MSDFKRQQELRSREMPEAITTLEEIAEWIAVIAELSGDYEVAHSLEDRLRAAVLRGIAQTSEGSSERAWAVLQTSNIEFERWCA
jgi:hypothetical protein